MSPRVCTAAGTHGLCLAPATQVIVIGLDGCDPGSMDACATCAERIIYEQGEPGALVAVPSPFLAATVTQG